MNLKKALQNFTLAVLAAPVLLTACSGSQTQLKTDGMFLSADEVHGAVGSFFGAWTADECSEVRGQSQSKTCSISITLSQGQIQSASSTLSTLQVSAVVKSDLSDKVPKSTVRENSLTIPSGADKISVAINSNTLEQIDTSSTPNKVENVGRIGAKAFTLQMNGMSLIFELTSSNEARLVLFGFGDDKSGLVRTDHLTLQVGSP